MNIEGARWQRANRRARLGGATAGLLFGVFYALYLISGNPYFSGAHYNDAVVTLLGCAASGLLLGFLCGPMLSVHPYRWLLATLEIATPGQIIGGAIGLLIALLTSALLAFALSILGAIGVLIALGFTLALVPVGVRTGVSRQADILGALRDGAQRHFAAAPDPLDGIPVVVDTSALIDGRLEEIAKAGFVPGRLLIPTFVLEELQRVADSADPHKRLRGRRGLEVVNRLRTANDVRVEVLEITSPGATEVDAAVVRLAHSRGGCVMTTDFNLNQLAQAEGLRVLNVNLLAAAVASSAAAGDVLEVLIMRPGREHHQGIAHLDDGTMVVVDGGRDLIGKTVTVTVSRVLQTAAGRMLFAAAAPAAQGARYRKTERR